MATEIAARAKQSALNAPDGDDYETFCAALSASARGRAFLTEYTRRNRNADTEQLLAAIAQLQETVAANTAPKVTDTIKAELRALLDEIAAAQHDLEASLVATKATKLAELVALVARRITAIVTSVQIEGLPAADVIQLSVPEEQKDAAERTHLAVVPTPEQPELPIPSPLVTPLPPIALVHSEMMMAEVAFAGPLPSAPDVKPELVTVEVSKLEAAILPPVPAVTAPKPNKPVGALASIMALSEEERLALFT